MTLYNGRHAVRVSRRSNGELTYTCMTYRSYRWRVRLLTLTLAVVFLVALLGLPQDNLVFLPHSSYLLGLIDRLMIWLMMLGVPLAVCRFTPLGGYHAAEHQVIRTSMSGALTPERIQRAERTSAYCGTVITALVLPGLLPFSFVPMDSMYYLSVVAALLVLAVFSLGRFPQLRRHRVVRQLGLAYQQHITTKPATQNQIQVAHACALMLSSL